MLSAIRQILPGIEYCYLADNLYFPYGEKSEEELNERMLSLFRQLEVDVHYDVVVVACNSASTAVLDELRRNFSVPFVGVVPAIKPAAERTKTGRIGLLATPGTVSREYTRQLMMQFAGHCDVVCVGAPELAAVAEEKLRGEQPCYQYLAETIRPFLEQEVDVGILGCTHFPWLSDELTELAPQIHWIDSGLAIANRVKSLLFDGGGGLARAKDSTPTFYLTANCDLAVLKSQFPEFVSWQFLD